jgi:hypothetical protein
MFFFVYENSSVTLLEATIALNVFIERFNISDIGTNGFLKLLQFLPPSNNLSKTKKRLKKLFCNVTDMKINKHCSKCMGIVVDKVCNSISCMKQHASWIRLLFVKLNHKLRTYFGTIMIH